MRLQSFKQRTLQENFSEAEVLSKCCLSKGLIMLLFWELRSFLQSITLHSHAISSMTKLLAGLNCLGKGSYQTVGGEVVGVFQSSFTCPCRV